jgi:hypothetical protein
MCVYSHSLNNCLKVETKWMDPIFLYKIIVLTKECTVPLDCKIMVIDCYFFIIFFINISIMIDTNLCRYV